MHAPILLSRQLAPRKMLMVRPWDVQAFGVRRMQFCCENIVGMSHMCTHNANESLCNAAGHVRWMETMIRKRCSDCRRYKMLRTPFPTKCL